MELISKFRIIFVVQSIIGNITATIHMLARVIYTPFQPDLFKVNLGFTGVYISFLPLVLNIECGFSLELPQCGPI